MKTTAIPTLLALLTGAIATAQPPQGGPQGQGGPRPPAPLVGVLDADHDHTISAEEIAAAPTALAALDEDGDGSLSREEIRPPRPDGNDGQGRDGKKSKRKGQGPDGPPPGDDEAPDGRPGRRPVPPVLAALDSDKDGTLSPAEIAAAPAALATLDKNADGELTPDEFAPDGRRRKGQPQRPAKH